jgi:peptide/nickel transport system ATP-binding protein
MAGSWIRQRTCAPPTTSCCGWRTWSWSFPAKGGRKVNAVSNISFDVAPGETLGLVGESGCGKSTTGKAIMQLPPPTRATCTLDGTDLTSLKGEALRNPASMQMIFQDPISSLNPRRTVITSCRSRSTSGDRHRRGASGQGRVHTGERGRRPESGGERKPHEFSGGQCQRISIARAVITDPKLIICDEPVSALDVSVQAQILNLLEEMKQRYGLTLVFIAHDLAVVKNISDRVAVMYLGKMCEVGPPDTLYDSPGPPVHRGADLGDPGARPRRAPGRRAPSRGRAALADQPAFGLPVPHPLHPADSHDTIRVQGARRTTSRTSASRSPSAG